MAEVPYRAELEGLEGGSTMVRSLQAILDTLRNTPFRISNRAVHVGSGAPNNNEVGSVGDLYLRSTDLSSQQVLYVKVDGNDIASGWLLVPLIPNAGFATGEVPYNDGTPAGLKTSSAFVFDGTSLTMGGQLSFPAAQLPSTGANVLDDYEEGSWTPVIGGSGGTSGQAYTTQAGYYVKIGQLVFATFVAVLSNKGTITSSVQIQGFPFSSSNLGTDRFVGTLQWSALATTWVTIMTLMVGNATVATVRGATAADTANTTDLVTADIGNTTSLAGTLVYRAGN